MDLVYKKGEPLADTADMYNMNVPLLKVYKPKIRDLARDIFTPMQEEPMGGN